MLVLRRKRGEGLHIGPDIHIQIVDITPSKVVIGIDAPDDLKVLRDELISYNEGNTDDLR
jgi:carbon storage regulator